MQTKYIVCHPNMKASVQAAFADLEIVVDETVASYEFREKELDFAELMEEELEKAEKQDADPKDAVTYVVPVVAKYSDLDNGLVLATFLTIRVQRGSIEPSKVVKVVKKQEAIVRKDYDPLTHTSPFAVSTIMADLKAALREKGANVLSISEAEGLTLLGES